MAEKVVSVRLQARVEGFTAGMRKAKASVDDLTKADVPKAAKGYSDLANSAALAGVAVAAGLGIAVKRFAEFDQAMSSVRANVGGTVEEMAALRAAALKLGADSQFTATEAAQGINELGKAGLSTQAILNGGLKGALDLAAAGQIGVAQAAETTATALSQFKLGGDKAVHVADLLAAGANKAQGGVGDLGAALQQAGLVAAGMGLSVEETTAGLTAFAKAGLIGSDAGTSFKTMIQRLQAPMGDAKAMLDKYGISAYDASGQFVGLANVAGQLQDRFKNLTPAVRNNALAVIFGSDAIRGANVLYENGAAGIANWVKEVDQTGFAAKQAAALTDNLKGDLERLGGALDTVLIQTGTGVNDSLRTLTQGLQGFVEGVGRVPGPLLLAGGALASLALLAPKGIRAYREYAATMDSVGLSFDKISAKGPRAAQAVNAVTGSAKAFGTAMAIIAATGAVDAVFGTDSSRPGIEVLTRDFETAGNSVDAFSARLQTYSEQSSNWFSVDSVRSYSDVLHNTFDPGLSDQIDHAVGSIASFFGVTDKSRITSSANAMHDLDASLAGMVASGNIEGAAQVYKQFADAAERTGVKADEFKAKLPGYANSLAGAAGPAKKVALSVKDMGDNLVDAAGKTDSISAAMLALGGSATAASDEVKGLANVIQGDMDAASKAFAGDLDVISKYDPEKASGNVKKASKKSADAEKSLQNVRDRIAAKKKTTVADTQALEAATTKAAEARAAKVKAADEATGESLASLYKRSVTEAKKFAADIERATEAGLDPAVVAKLLEAGPEKAAPILAELLGKHGANMIRMVNDSEAALTALNQKVVEQSRLTAIAVNATSDEVAGHLDEATRIAAAKAAAGGAATAEDLAAKLKLPLDTVIQVAQEFGIELAASIPDEIGVGVKVNGVDAAKTEIDNFRTALDVPPEVGTFVRVTGATDATTELDIFRTSVTETPDTKDVAVSTTGTPQAVIDLLTVKNPLDLLTGKNIPISVSGVASAISQIDVLLGKLTALTGRAPTHADYKAAQENAANGPHKATGGAIYGPGTGTSDSIPAWLSNGEHVLTAAEVAKLGGQSAVYAMRAAIRAGRAPQFASGGAVQYAPATQYVQVAGGASSVTETHSAPVYIDKVVGLTIAEVEREAATRRRRDALSPSRGR